MRKLDIVKFHDGTLSYILAHYLLYSICTKITLLANDTLFDNKMYVMQEKLSKPDHPIKS